MTVDGVQSPRERCTTAVVRQTSIAGWSATNKPIRMRRQLWLAPLAQLCFDSSRARWRTGNRLMTCCRKRGCGFIACGTRTALVSRSCLGYMPSQGGCAWTATAGRDASRCTRLRWRCCRSGRREAEARNPGPAFDTLVAALPEAQREVVTMLKVGGLSSGRSSPCHVIYRGRRETESAPRLRAAAQITTNPSRGRGERSCSMNCKDVDRALSEESRLPLASPGSPENL